MAPSPPSVPLSAPPSAAPSAAERPARAERRRPRVDPAVVVTWATAALLVVASAVRARDGHATLDLAMFEQAVWNASPGHAPTSTIIGANILGDHFAPGLLLFAPLYAVAATPLWFFAAQGAAAAAAVTGLVRRIRPHTGAVTAALFGLALMASPPVASALLDDFHPIVVSAPFALLAVFAGERGQWRRAAAWGVLAALFRVEVGAAVAVALLITPVASAASGRSAKVRRWSAVAPIACYLVVALALESRLSSVDHWAPHYGYLGAGPLAALAHPVRILRALVSVETAVRMFPWFAATGFVALRRPRLVLPALVIGSPVVLSSWRGTAVWSLHYGILPAVLLIPAVVAVIRERDDGRALATRAAVIAIAFAVAFGPLSPVRLDIRAHARSGVADALAGGDELARATRGIPGDAVVSALGGATALLAERPAVYLWPYPFLDSPAGILPPPLGPTADPARAGDGRVRGHPGHRRGDAAARVRRGPAHGPLRAAAADLAAGPGALTARSPRRGTVTRAGRPARAPAADRRRAPVPGGSSPTCGPRPAPTRR